MYDPQASTMALPVLTSLKDCTSFTKTVLPFLPQLSISHVKPLLAGEVAPKEWYLSTNPLVTAVMLCLTVAALTLALSEINRNYSQVDRLWSLLPSLYIGHFTLFAHLKGFPTERLDTLATFVALWSIRLTYNYWRRGGYNVGSEDYRWTLVRKDYSRPCFFLFNIVFISLFQNLLLLALASPAYLFLLASTLPAASQFTTTDLIISRLLMILLLLELLADQQQWSYQTAKAAYKATGVVPAGFDKADLDRGFVVSGLWTLSRHPNFACEQAIWAGVYQWGCVITDALFNWTAVGAICLLLLFQGSTNLTESITAKKYSEYEEYQRRVSKFLPGIGTFKGFSVAVVEGTVQKKRE
ncbi:hypothetical protein RUND412_010876 [Rhizina undulata]